MKKIVLLVMSLLSVRIDMLVSSTLKIPSFSTVQLTAAERAKSCKDNSYKAAAISFVRTIRYVKKLKTFITEVQNSIEYVSNQIENLADDSIFRRERIKDLQNGIKETQELIKQLSDKIGNTFEPVQKGLAPKTVELTEKLNMKIKNQISTKKTTTFFGEMQAQANQLKLIADALADGRNVIKRDINMLMCLGPQSKWPQDWTKKYGANCEKKFATLKPEQRKFKKRQIEQKLNIRHRQLGLNQTAINETQKVIQKLDKKVLQELISQIEMYAQDIKESHAAILFHQKVFSEDQKKIIELQNKLKSFYVPLLEKTKDLIQSKANELKVMAKNKDMFDGCPSFIQDLL